MTAIKPRAARLLRYSGTKRYFAETGWTEDLHSARVFSDVMEVAEVCLQYGLVDVELVIRDANLDFNTSCQPVPTPPVSG